MSSTQEFNCIFCKDTFENKEDLQIHFRKHGDPKFNQGQKGKSRPQSEAQSSVEKKSEEVEMVSCDVCPETFPTISKAITHKHKVHPEHDAKYFCPWCGKLFTMKHLYNKHLQSNHVNMAKSEETNFHCDACNVDFFVPSAMLYHNKFFHRQDTDLPTIGQSKKLKMCQQEVLQIYYCAFCGDEYDNKVNLHKHMSDDHGDENQSPEDVLRCPLCEAIFYHLDAYEVHLTFHSTDDLYSEKNEMFEQITEYSLETVPPIVEKVENVEPQEDVESAMKAVGIDKFLEMAMEKDSNSAKKSKKHKKHKKKKKEAITLDEFLNMNKDVFGEGLDFQGIEEVPTQVVAKRLKQKRPDKLKLSSLRVAQSSELEKLKKQGIVIKMKPTKKPAVQNFKIGEKVVTKPIQNINKPSTVQSSPDEVLSKLINQSNNQIKIFKKSFQDNQESDLQEDQGTSGEEKTIFDKRVSPENIEVECDVNMPSEYTSSENEAKEDIVKNGNKPLNEDKKIMAKLSTENIINTNHNDLKKNQDNPDSPKELVANCKDKYSDPNEASSKNENNKEFLPKDKNVNELSAVTALKNTGYITIKPVTKNIFPSSDEISEDKKPKENPTNDTEEEHDNISNEPENSTSNSLDALKHLSHLITVKSLNPNRSLTPIPIKQTKITENEEALDDQDGFEDNEDKETEEMSKEIPPVHAQIKNDKSLDTLNSFKNLNKNITIKPVTHSPKAIPEKIYEGEGEEDGNKIIENVNAERVVPSNAIKSATAVKNAHNVPSPKGQDISKTAKPDIVKDILSGTQEKQSSMKLLKHLTNVTAKPVSAVRSNIQQNVNNTQTTQNVTKPQAIQSFVKKQETVKEIEIFNIDDSDDEPTEPPVNKISSPKPNLTESKPAHSLDTLKNISKHITVKPVQQSSQINKSIVKQNNAEEIATSRQQCSISNFSDEDDDQDTLIPTNVNTVQQKLKLQNNHLQNTLKNLRKHITVKSGNPSPNSSVKSSKDHNSRDNFDDAADSDDSFSGKVKITEMSDENSMGNDMLGPSNTINNTGYNENATVKSPGESNSEHEHFDDEDDEFDDLESQIKASTLKKPIDNLNKVMNYKNINKNITIKSLADKKGLKEDTKNTTVPKMNSELMIKPFKQIKNDGKDETFANKNTIMNAAQVKRSIINQNQSMNQSIASSSQQNTVNKEVTVKTFQTKTVIQEITTTVTKTIKTVNQTVKQEVQSKSQNNFTKFQKVQGMKTSNQQIKNFQGVTVRHATPIAGTKIRGGAPLNIGSSVRPSNQLVPCNQLVPVRPARNTARMSVPRMPAVKKNITPGSTIRPPRPAIGRPLKISPNAVSTIKRAAEEPTGHFSCFKKPKESLIPVSEIPSFAGDQGGESVVHYTSSQMSRSNVTSATKTVRGNTVVTQMKSEVSASSQHLEKLNSMSGLKVVKTSQKQAMNVEEKCELSPSKRHTLEAIEKLQKQGLLVKKPRLEDVSNESDHSDEGDDYITEEPED